VGRVAVAPALAEVDPPGEFTHHQEVGPGDPLLLQRAGVDQGRRRLDRSEVGIEPERLADAEQPLFRARGAGVDGDQLVPLGSAYRPEQDCVAAAAGVDDVVMQGEAVFVYRNPADQVLLVVENGDLVEHPSGGGDYFGADSVPGEYDDLSWLAQVLNAPRG